ncbi:LAME_0G10880g1_1 [Lachancea meyersii CBS 8951]|uniref:25S rRNA adenine-N(1) methyltransferase n=1 Tax=Lachancea meyersii CBS 8951 TaxID=1266667 RepID=A0A1G4K940_9SACH|nr:LAME_0G10880g1_1 [Lachancea meyersii CBS 8951]
MLLRRRKTVTGKPVLQRKPTIKPDKARRVIRRFHLLINKRRVIAGKLKLQVADNDEARTKVLVKQKIKTLGLESHYREGWSASHPDTQLETDMLKIHETHQLDCLARILGYIMSEINERGGLQNYQIASTIGQDKNRGGDSSKILIKWFQAVRDPGHQYRALELGSLSAKNAISTSGTFKLVVRIDLNSNDPVNIQRQDFMERPIPENDSERFDLISCSLVLNFVPNPRLRGQMLMRLNSFLRQDVKSAYVFLVLPLPCVANSRYMTETRLCDIMAHLGYRTINQHKSHKIIYLLFERQADCISDKGAMKDDFSKKKCCEINQA